MRSIVRSNNTPTAISFAAVVLASMLWASPSWAQRFPVPWNQPQLAQRVDIRGPQQPLLGNVDAPITIVSFSDYRCPYCRMLSATLDDLLEQYAGQVRVIYRHLAYTSESRAASEAALCAAEQEKFAEYHRLIFETPTVTADGLIGLAGHLGLDLEKFRECTQTNRYAARIDGDIREGERLGIQVTPTIFVNGERVTGAVPAPKLRESINRLLSAAAVGGNGR